jgi:preprotein translocase subunit SecG
MFTLLMIIELVLAILLILVVLMQSSKGGGLAGTFGGGSVGMVFGVRRTADFLTKATQVLAISFGLIALIINIFFLPRAKSPTPESVIQRSGATQQQQTMPQLPPSPPPTSTTPNQ